RQSVSKEDVDETNHFRISNHTCHFLDRLSCARSATITNGEGAPWLLESHADGRIRMERIWNDLLAQPQLLERRRISAHRRKWKPLRQRVLRCRECGGQWSDHRGR